MDRAGAGDVSEEYFKMIKMMAAAQAGKEGKRETSPTCWIHSNY